MLIISLLLINCFYFRNKTIKYNDIKYEIRYDEYGLMLFDENNCGDFHLNSVYSNKKVFLMQLYDYQKKTNFWVKFQNNQLYLVDTSKYDLHKFKKVEYESIR